MRTASAAVLLLFSLAALGDVPSGNDTRASEAAKKGLARRGEYTPNFQRPSYDRERIQHLSEQAHARGRVELERLRADAKRLTGADPESASADPSRPTVSGRVVVAISSSMPDPMLTTYLQQLDGRPESLVVLRGFVGGAQHVKPTGQFIERIRRKSSDPQGPHYAVETVVDPMLFQQLGIDQVPAVAWLGGIQDLSHCNGEDYSKAIVIFGAASVESALREAHKAGAGVPDAVLARYAAKGWEHR